MWGVIHRTTNAGVTPMHDIAGRPLLARQLMWLRRIGCDQIALEVGPGESGAAVTRWLAKGDAITLDVVPVLAARALGAPEIARRAGMRHGSAFVAIPSDVLGDADPGKLFGEIELADRVARPAPPSCLPGLEVGRISIGRGERAVSRGECPGWTVRLRNEAEAFAVARVALSRALGAEGDHPLALAGTEVAPGVVVGRGARIDEGADIRPPVLLGPGALVRAGAIVGPFAVLGAGCVVDRGARVTEARVAVGTIVGEGLDVSGMDVGPRGLRALEGEFSTRVSLGDGLLIASAAPRGDRAARWVAFVALLFVAPLARLRGGARLTELADALSDVLAGRRALVGPRELLESRRGSPGLRNASARAQLGVIDIEPAIAPSAKDSLTRLRARAWYAAAKSPRVDAMLLGRLLLARRQARAVGR